MATAFNPAVGEVPMGAGPGPQGPIARGGPTKGLQWVSGRVDPERQSPDFERGGRVMFRGFLPGVTARDAAVPAQQHARAVNADGANPYGWAANSNSFAGDTEEGLFGCRVGDARTIGFMTHLRETPSPPQFIPGLTALTPLM